MCTVALSRVIFLTLLAGLSAGSTGDWTAVSSGNWSDPQVWQARSVPPAGASVTIPAAVSVLFDAVGAPPLQTLAVDGGDLRFAPADLHLQAHFIILSNGGRLQAGTPEQPFLQQLVITLLGNRTHSEEAPVYGAKAIAIAGGHLELHGVAHTSWSRLAAHAANASLELTLEKAVGWRAGQRIIITSTDFDLEQTEERHIRFVSGTKVGLDVPLAYSHFGELQTFGGRVLDERAEVGLLSRNIVVQGSGGSESEEYGCQIMATAGRLRLVNVEVSHCGQRSSLARYPVHFHLFGNASGSYVKNCSIHDNYNRAVALHGVHSALIKDNVVFNTKGHAVFVEDAIETKNIVHGNLVVSTRAATSLLHTDQTPAAFWVTNPDNDFSGNVAAGSERYGFWFSLPAKPTGPSADAPLAADMCPVHSPLLRFADNTAHSCRKNGLHVYVEWTALLDGYGKHCSLWKATAVPVFIERFVAYKCRGAGYHAHRTGELRCIGCVFADNQWAWQHNQVTIGKDVRITSSLVVGQSANIGNPTPESCSDAATPCCTESGVSRTVPAVRWHTQHYGVQIPFTGEIAVTNTTFANFRTQVCEHRYDSGKGWIPSYFTSSNHEIALHALINQNQWYTSRVMALGDNAFVQVGRNNSNAFRFVHSTAHDGANFAAFVATTAHAALGIQENETIVAATLGALVRGCAERPAWNAYVCPSTVQFRPLHVYNREKPAAYVGPMKVTGHGGATDVVRGATTIRFFPTLAVSQAYRLEFAKRTPLELEMLLQQTVEGDAVLLEVRYDSTISGAVVHRANHHWGDWYDSTIGMAASMPTLESEHGTWHYSPESKVLTLLIKHSRVWASKVKVVATAASAVAPASAGACLSNGSNYFALRWSLPSTWSGGGTNATLADPTSGMSPQVVPRSGDDVRIGCRVVVSLDTSPPLLGHVVVYGTLQFARKDLNLTAASIRVMHAGVFAIGTASQPFVHRARIQIAGDRYDTVPGFGARVFAASGGGQLQLHGSGSARSSWSKLSVSAGTGDVHLQTDARLSSHWANRTVVITSSGAGAETAQTTFVSRDSNVLGVSARLLFGHKGFAQTNERVDDRSAVGLLSRNIVIEPWGAVSSISCKLVIANGSQVRMQHVEVRQCGQTQVSAAVDVRMTGKHNASGSYIRDCSIHGSADSGISVSGDAGSLTVEDNVIFSTVGPAVVVHSGVHNVRRNMAVASAVDTFARVGTYVFNTRDTPAFLVKTMRSVISGNLASGGRGSGFLFALGKLADWEVQSGLTPAEAREQRPFAQMTNNTAAHFHRSGVQISGYSGLRNATFGIHGLVALNNGQHGVHAWRSTLNIAVSSSTFADSAQTGVTIVSWFPANRHTVSGSLFVGATGPGAAVSASAAAIRIPALLGGSQMIGGRLLPRIKNTCPCTYNQLSPGRSAVFVDGCTFMNYSGPTQAAFQANTKGDGAPAFWASNLTFSSATAVWFPSPQCQSASKGATSMTTLLLPSGCDAATQAIIFDDGSVSKSVTGIGTSGPAAIVTNSSALAQIYAHANDRPCTHVAAWNAHVCPANPKAAASHIVPALFVESLDDDAFIRYMGPVSFAADAGAGPVNVVYGRQDDSGMHLSVGSVFMASLLNNQTYLVSFGGTMPKHLVFSFRGAFTSHRRVEAVLSVDLLLQYKRPALLRVFKDGAQMPDAKQDCKTGLLRLTVDAGSGSVYEVQTSGEREESCFCCSHDLRALMSATLRLALNISTAGGPGTMQRRSFEARFARDVSAALGINADRILVIGVRAGSIIVDFQVLAGSNEGNVTTNTTLAEAAALHRALQAQLAEPSSQLYAGDVTAAVDRSGSGVTAVFNASGATPPTPAAAPSPHPAPATTTASMAGESGRSWSPHVVAGVVVGVLGLVALLVVARQRQCKVHSGVSRNETTASKPLPQDAVNPEPTPPGTLGENGGATGPLPPGWKAAHDAVSNRTYFFNPSNGESSWARPEQSGGGSIVAKGNDRYMV